MCKRLVFIFIFKFKIQSYTMHCYVTFAKQARMQHKTQTTQILRKFVRVRLAQKKKLSICEQNSAGRRKTHWLLLYIFSHKNKQKFSLLTVFFPSSLTLFLSQPNQLYFIIKKRRRSLLLLVYFFYFIYLLLTELN